MYRHQLPLLVLALAGAAPTTARAQNPTSTPSMVGTLPSRFIAPEVLARMWARPDGVEDAVLLAAPADSVWVALRATLQEFEVPVGFEDRAAGEIGHVRAKLFRRMGKQALSTYLRCGSGMTGPNADSYMVYLSFVAFMRPGPDGKTAVVPLLTAQAVDLPNGRNEVVNCTSSGSLEKRLGDRLRKRLGEA